VSVRGADRGATLRAVVLRSTVFRSAQNMVSSFIDIPFNVLKGTFLHTSALTFRRDTKGPATVGLDSRILNSHRIGVGTCGIKALAGTVPQATGLESSRAWNDLSLGVHNKGPVVLRDVSPIGLTPRRGVRGVPFANLDVRQLVTRNQSPLPKAIVGPAMNRRRSLPRCRAADRYTRAL